MDRANITFSPVSQSEQIALTRKQLKTLLRIARATPAAIEVVGHNPSATVEVYEDPVEPGSLASRYHLSADGTYDKEQCQVPEDDGDWEWEPEGGWVDGATVTPEEATRLGLAWRAPKVKKPKRGRRTVDEQFGDEVVLQCGEPGCTTLFATGRSLWKDAQIEGREAGWDVESNPERCPDHKVKKPKKPKKLYLSDKFTIRNNPNPVMDQQFEHEEVKDLPVNQVWTVVEGDSGKLYAVTGFHIINKMHYVVTEEPWTKEDESIDYKW